MPFANLSKRTQRGNPTCKLDGSAQQSSLPPAGCSSWRVRATRRRCGCASNSFRHLVTKRTVIFALPRIERADDVSTAITPHLGGRSRHVHAGRKGEDRAGGRNLYPAIDTTGRRRFAVDPLQILGLADLNETDDCISDEDDETCANRSRSVRHSLWLGRMSAPNILVGWCLGGEQILPQSSARRGRAMHSGALSDAAPTRSTRPSRIWHRSTTRSPLCPGSCIPHPRQTKKLGHTSVRPKFREETPRRRTVGPQPVIVTALHNLVLFTGMSSCFLETRCRALRFGAGSGV
jgi:hypothetical protein